MIDPDIWFIETISGTLGAFNRSKVDDLSKPIRQFLLRVVQCFHCLPCCWEYCSDPDKSLEETCK